jgi:UDP-glucose 4-epimerase
MNVLVTGGAGFIGSHIVKKHLDKKDFVSIIDNFSTGNTNNLPLNQKYITSIDTDYSKIDKLRLDCIYHLGMPSSSPMYKEKPQLVASAISDSLRVMEYAKDHQIPVVFASTSSLYNKSMVPSDEFSSIMVTDYYTETRYAIERLFELYDHLYDVKSVGLRLFSVYGPREKSKGKYANLVTQFLLDMMEDRNPVLYFKGEQTRDFVYVDDVVECFLIAMEKLLKQHPLPSVINVGTGITISLNELVWLINNKLGKSIEPSYLQPKNLNNYVEVTQADTGRMKACLGKKDFISLPSGIERLISYYYGV